MITTKMIPESDDKIYEILSDNRITRIDVDLCRIQHNDEIEDIMNIFDYKNDRERVLVLELMGLLAQEQRREVMDYFCNEYNLPINYNISREDCVLLLTACLLNPLFYSFAKSDYKSIKARLNQVNQNEITSSDVKNELENEIHNEYPWGKIIIINNKNNVIKNNLKAKISLNDDMYYKAASTEGWITFNEIKDININNICGELQFQKHSDHGFRLKFQFTVPQKKLYFDKIEVSFTAKNNGKEKEESVNILTDDVHCQFNGDQEVIFILSEPSREIDYNSDIDKNLTIEFINNYN